MMHLKKIASLALLTTFFLAACGSSPAGAPQTQGGLKTYTNNELGFSFQFPAEWVYVNFEKQLPGSTYVNYKGDFTLMLPSPQQQALEENITKAVLLSKKVGDHSTLNVVYKNSGCDPKLDIFVTALRPGHGENDYPLNVYINENVEKQMLRGKISCDQSQTFKKIAEQIDAGTYSQKLSDKIKVAQQLTDSLIQN